MSWSVNYFLNFFRQTWGSIDYDNPLFDVKLLFFVCRGPPAPLDRLFQLESERFGDVVYLECEEKYNDLTAKAMLMYRSEL